jgi:hypothetical protein
MDKIFEHLFPNLKPFLEEFLKNHKLLFLKNYIEVLYWLSVLIIVWILKSIFISISNLIKNHRINVNSNDLLRYYSSKEIYDATRNYLTTHGQSNDPADFLELKEALKKPIEKRNLIRSFINEFSKKDFEKSFFLILGDSGIGKTTFLINLYIKFKLSYFPLKKRPIYLISLSDSNYFTQIQELKKTSINSILLLDAFDEDVTSWHNPEESLKNLLKEVSGFYTVVLSSRGHFFSSKINEVSRIELFSKLANKEQFKLNKIYLSPINNSSIYFYLVKKYFFKAPFKIFKSYKIVQQCPNLIVRPMLLNNVDYLITSQKKYIFTAEIYFKLILSWIGREKQFVDEVSILEFSKDVANYMYENRNKHKGLYIHEGELALFLKISNITIDSVIMKTRSLLNRTDDKYKFSHKSIFEYFLAYSKFESMNIEYLYNMQLNNPFSLEGLSEAERFFKELFFLKITIPYLEKYTSYSIDSYTLVKTRALNLEGSKITTLLFIKEMDWIESLNLNRTLVRDLTPLYSLTKLKKLELKGTYYDPMGDYPGDPKKQVDDLKGALPNLIIIF